MYAIDNIVLQLFVQVWCDLVQTHCGLSMSLTQAQAGTRFLEGKKKIRDPQRKCEVVKMFSLRNVLRIEGISQTHHLDLKMLTTLQTL
jgi:hypothetical protein